MSKGKYSRYVISAPTLKGDFPPLAQRMVYDGLLKGGSGNVGIRYSYFYGPPFQFEVPHKHDYDQFLCFLGTPEDVRVFDAEWRYGWVRKGKNTPSPSLPSSMYLRGCCTAP